MYICTSCQKKRMLEYGFGMYSNLQTSSSEYCAGEKVGDTTVSAVISDET